MSRPLVEGGWHVSHVVGLVHYDLEGKENFAGIIIAGNSAAYGTRTLQFELHSCRGPISLLSIQSRSRDGSSLSQFAPKPASPRDHPFLTRPAGEVGFGSSMISNRLGARRTLTPLSLSGFLHFHTEAGPRRLCDPPLDLQHSLKRPAGGCEEFLANRSRGLSDFESGRTPSRFYSSRLSWHSRRPRASFCCPYEEL